MPRVPWYERLVRPLVWLLLQLLTALCGPWSRTTSG
jgi:hypothetical protein